MLNRRVAAGANLPLFVLLPLLLVGVPSHTRAQQAESTRIGTLSLDGFSIVSFEDRQTLMIPGGSSIRFRFGAPNTDGSIPFEIRPSDVVIPEIPLPRSNGTLTYGLAAPARGLARAAADGAAQMSFAAEVTVTLSLDGETGTATYPLSFTTETASATSADGQETIALDGARLSQAGNSIQLVGATTNRTDAFPEPGRVVYAVLSGTFDQLPLPK